MTTGSGHDQHSHFLARAIELARYGAERGDGGPFGSLVVRAGQVVGEGWNRVIRDNDPTAHAEVTAIRAACAASGSFQLTDSVVYASCEPCPMCLGALYWARPAGVYFAATREDAARAGFDDSMIYDQLALEPAERSLPTRRIETAGSAEVFTYWMNRPGRTRY